MIVHAYAVDGGAGHSRWDNADQLLATEEIRQPIATETQKDRAEMKAARMSFFRPA